jgi:poly(3-hydroxybutyrate) depolymerase
MGHSVSSGWGERPGQPVATAQLRPGSTERYRAGELAEIDAMTVLRTMREKYTVDSGRIYLMGHSMGGGGTYHLGAKYKDIWAGLAPIAGLGGIADAAAAEPFKSIPMLLLHGEKDSIIPPPSRAARCWRSRRSAHRMCISNSLERITSSSFAAAPSTWRRFSCSLPPSRNTPM